MYKTILVHVDSSARAAERIDVAARLARAHEAHLVGAAMTGMSPFMYPVGGFDPLLAAAAFPLEQMRAEAERALDGFEARVRTTSLGSFERRRMDEEAGMGLCMQARYCDLVVIGQPLPGATAPLLRSAMPEYVLLHCARPVLVIPAHGKVGQLGENVTVAWNGSANAVRAITSAIPLLRRARQVQLVVFNPDDVAALHGELPGADMGLYMARHGVRVDVCVKKRSADAGAALLEHAAAAGADLIVMGAYGHSRFRETLLGGATRYALLHSTLPLWMSH